MAKSHSLVKKSGNDVIALIKLKDSSFSNDLDFEVVLNSLLFLLSFLKTLLKGSSFCSFDGVFYKTKTLRKPQMLMFLVTSSVENHVPV